MRSCPFCAGTDVKFVKHKHPDGHLICFMRCQGCLADGPCRTYHDEWDEEEALNAWSSRFDLNRALKSGLFRHETAQQWVCQYWKAVRAAVDGDDLVMFQRSRSIGPIFMGAGVGAAAAGDKHLSDDFHFLSDLVGSIQRDWLEEWMGNQS